MIAAFVRHPTAAALFAVALTALGVASLPQLARETFPRIPEREVEIVVGYPGASASDVEDAVCRRIEDAVEGTLSLAEIRCDAEEGRAAAIAEMREGADYAQFLADLRTEIDAVDDFPEASEAPLVRALGRSDLVAAVAVTGPAPAVHLEDYAERVKERLNRLEEVARIDFLGFSPRQFQIEVPAAVMRAYGLDPPSLASAIARAGLDLPGGIVETPGGDVMVRVEDERRSVRRLEDLAIFAGRDGERLVLGDIARIRESHERPESRIEFDGQRAAMLEIRKLPGQDALAALAAVERVLDDIRTAAPSGITLQVVQDQTPLIRDRLAMLVENGVLGLVLVVLSLSLFFGQRTAGAIAFVLPFSLLGALAFMAALGLTLNMITMVALLMAIGLIMDSAIIIGENVVARRQAGDVPAAAAAEGTREVAPGVVSSFLTTACVFLPLTLLSGDIGQVLSALPVALLAALTVSLAASFAVVPRAMLGALRAPERSRTGAIGRLRRGFLAAFDTFAERVVVPAVAAAIRARHLVAGLLLMALLTSAALIAGGHVKFQALADVEGDVAEVRILMPQGTPLARTQEVVERVTQALDDIDARHRRDDPKERALVRHVRVRYDHNPDARERGSHVATVTADLLSAEERAVTMEALFASWREGIGAIADAVVLTMGEPALGPQGRALELRLSHADLEVLQAAGRELADWLSAYDGTRDVTSDLRPGKPERRIAASAAGQALGLDSRAIAEQLRGAYHGAPVRDVQAGRHAYEIIVRQDRADRSSLAALETFPIHLPQGGYAPLRAVAEITSDRGFARIPRVDGLRTVTVTGEVDARRANAMEIVADTTSRFLPELRARYPGLAFTVMGQPREAEITGGSIRRGFLAGLAAVFVILAVQFRSYRDAVVAMTAIPMAIAGAVLGHALMGYTLSMPSIVGAVSLAGFVVNNAILLMLFIRTHESAGLDRGRAAIAASRARARPLFLISATTILGLLPLLAETSLQAEVLKPLAISVVFGLVTASLMVTFVLPALYVLAHGRGAEAAPREVEASA